MSNPFGGHPTLGDYKRWAGQEAGCDVKNGVVHHPDKGPYSITKISASSGKWLHVVGTQDGEYLVPTQIARYDRRLGLKSPFFSIDPDSPFSEWTNVGERPN